MEQPPECTDSTVGLILGDFFSLGSVLLLLQAHDALHNGSEVLREHVVVKGRMGTRRLGLG